MDNPPLWSDAWWARVAARLRKLLPDTKCEVFEPSYLQVQLHGRCCYFHRSTRDDGSVYISVFGPTVPGVSVGRVFSCYLSVDSQDPDAVAVATTLAWLQMLAEGKAP